MKTLTAQESYKLASLKPRGHAPYSPSALRSWELCPGCESSGVAGPAAEEGSMLHHATETFNLNGLTEEQKDAVVYCHDYGSHLGPIVAEAGTEVQLDCGGLTWGTADLVVQDGPDLHVVDYKFGRNDVDPAETNLQGWAYAVGALTLFPRAETVTVHFLLPRLDVKTKHKFLRADLDKLKLRVATVIDRRKLYENTKDPTLLSPFPSNCLYCSRKATCAAMHTLALRAQPRGGEVFQVPAVAGICDLTTPEQLGQALTLVKTLADFCEQVGAHCKEQALNGTEVQGYELKERSGARKIEDPLATWLALKELIDQNDFISACQVSASKLEEAVGSKAPKGTKGKAVAAFKEKLKELGLITQAEPVYFLQKTKT